MDSYLAFNGGIYRMNEELCENENITLLELLDRLLGKGIVITGDLVISIANVDLIYIGLKLLISSVETLEKGMVLEAEDE